MLVTYLAICAGVFMFLTFLWSSNGALNCFIKTGLALMAIAAMILAVGQLLPAEIILQSGIKLY